MAGVFFFFFSKQLRVAPVTLGGKAGQVFGVLMMISLSKPAQTINGFEMLIRITWPLGKEDSTLRKKRKRKVGEDPQNIFLIFIPPMFFCFISSGNHSPLAAMHTIPQLL